MHTAQDWLDAEENPGLLHVSVYDGRVWLSEDMEAELLSYAGYLPKSDSVRDVLEFIEMERAKLQGATFSKGALQMNFQGFCLMTGLRHAIETKTFGKEHAGELPDLGMLQESFHCEIGSPKGFTIH